MLAIAVGLLGINAECATAFASKGFVVYARSVSDAEKLCKRTQKNGTFRCRSLSRLGLYLRAASHDFNSSV